jgi:hypothetical protein
VVDTLKKYQEIRSGEGTCEDGLLFPNLQGEPMRPSTISQHFERLAKRTGLPSTVRFHDLRHTCATLLLSKGIHSKIVQEILGHSTVSITLDTYSHVLPNVQKEAVRAMEGMISKGGRITAEYLLQEDIFVASEASRVARVTLLLLGPPDRDEPDSRSPRKSAGRAPDAHPDRPCGTHWGTGGTGARSGSCKPGTTGCERSTPG